MRIFIDSGFWDDDITEKLDENGKLTLLWLLTNPKISILGFIKNAERRFSYDFKIPVSVLQETVNSCEKMLSRCNGSIFIKNFIKYQYGHGLNLQKNKFWPQLEHAVETLHPLEYQELVNHYPMFSRIVNKPHPIPHTKGDTSPPSIPPMEKKSVQAMDMDMDMDKDNKRGVGGKEGADSTVVLPPRFPKTVEEAQAHSGFVGCSTDFAGTCWNQAVARGGCDARGNIIQSWRHHLACAASYDRERNAKNGGKVVNGSHRKTKEERESESKALLEQQRQRIKEHFNTESFSKTIVKVNKENT